MLVSLLPLPVSVVKLPLSAVPVAGGLGLLSGLTFGGGFAGVGSSSGETSQY